MNGSGETPSGWRSLTSLLRSTLDGLTSILLAPQCAACGEPLDAPTGGAVCAACWNRASSLSPPGCSSFPPHVAMATAIGPYEDSLKAIVHALKYERRPTIARHLAARMRAAGADLFQGADAVVPVPLHHTRERSRGFNQARALAQHLGIPVLDALVRVRPTEAQAELPATRRDANVRGAFIVRDTAAVDGLTLILVDDVSTTGATLNACAGPLLAAGAKEVRALTAAVAPLKAAPRRR